MNYTSSNHSGGAGGPGPTTPPPTGSRGQERSHEADTINVAVEAQPQSPPPSTSAASPGTVAEAAAAAPAAAPASAPAGRRNPVACRRCRRLRSKCIHQSINPPCEACKLAGSSAAAACYFPRRGEKDVDRQFRRRQIPAAERSSSASGSGVLYEGQQRQHRIHRPELTAKSPIETTQAQFGSSPIEERARRRESLESSHARIRPGLQAAAMGFDIDDALPPLDEIIEGCRIFVTSYFQLGFVPKAVFLENLVSKPGSVDRFLLACMLSISARFTPSLAKRYGSPRNATDYFLDIARALVPCEMYRPSIERTQAFFLLAICQWGNGDKDRSSMDMGVAVRMAAILKLHCEETYACDPGCPAEQVVRSEGARRVFWMIQSQENLHSGYKTPAPFPLEDITTLLPCNEEDFAFGVVPQDRAALAGTRPAKANTSLVHSPTRCLFATLIQAHSLWGTVARRAGRTGLDAAAPPPWHEESEHQTTLRELKHWEEKTPQRHTFSLWNLRGWKSESLHLAYLSITMVLRLSNIAIRRVYLDSMLSALAPGSRDSMSTEPERSAQNDAHNQLDNQQLPVPALGEAHVNAPDGFWEETSNSLFANVWQLYEQIEAFFTMRAPNEGFPQILVFCVYMTGSLATYLWRNPSLCPSLADKAEMMAQNALKILGELQAAWPTSSKWQRGLEQITTPLTGVSPADDQAGKTPGQQQVGLTPGHGEFQTALQSVQQRELVRDVSGVALAHEDADTEQFHSAFGIEGPGAGIFASDLFDAELEHFLQQGFHHDLLGTFPIPSYDSR